jgi:molecular chaperone DnaJ
MKNPYEVLGVSKSAGESDIKSAYRKLVMKYHPDKNPGDKAAEQNFKDVNNAYEILKDPQKKAAYDQFGDAAFGAGNGASAGTGFGGNPFGNMGAGGFHFNMNGFDMSDMMDEVLKNFGFDTGRDPSHAHAGRDMLHEIAIELRDAYFGTTQTIKFSGNAKCEKCGGFGTKDGKPAPVCQKCRGTGYIRSGGIIFGSERVCPDCNGTGHLIKEKCDACDGMGVQQKKREIEVKIPVGIEDGARLRLAGQGEAAPFGGASGDFYIDVRVRPHPVFARSGKNLAMRAEIPFATLALGGEYEITTIDERKLSVKIAAGTQMGEELRVKGAGMPGGDLFIKVATSIPKKLSAKQKKALEEFSNS